MAKGIQNPEEPQDTHNPYRPNGWWTTGHIFSTAANTGQLLVLFGFIIAILFIIRMPQNELPGLANKILHHLMTAEIIGWVLTAILLLSIPFFFKYQKKVQANNIKRLTSEIDTLQKELLNKLGEIEELENEIKKFSGESYNRFTDIKRLEEEIERLSGELLNRKNQ